MTARSKPLSYVMKDSYIQVIIAGKPHALDASHPTFSRLKRAITKKNWVAVPKLISVAESISTESHGDITVEKGKIFYKGTELHTGLSKRILNMVKEEKPVSHLIKFMNNLYKNPSQTAINEFYGWLDQHELPVTDDGCFLAYKSVDGNLKDEYSHKIDNSPGQTIMMPHRAGDEDYRQQCSSGYHVCSKQYGTYGSRVLAIKANPRYVYSAVQGKVRVSRYEVLMELGSISDSLFKLEGFSQLEKKLVVEIKKERKEMLGMLLSLPDIKRAIRRRKLSKKSLFKSSYARLKAMVQKRGLVPKVDPEDNKFLESARKAAGLTIGQVAKQMQVSYKAVANLESMYNPQQSKVDDYLESIVALTKSPYKAVTYPKPVRA